MHERERGGETGCVYVLVLRIVLVGESRGAELREEHVAHFCPRYTCVENVRAYPLLIVLVDAAVKDHLLMQRAMVILRLYVILDRADVEVGIVVHCACVA